MKANGGALHLIYLTRHPFAGTRSKLKVCCVYLRGRWRSRFAVCKCKHRVWICKRGFENNRGVNNRGKRITDYPHTISFRLTDEAWLGIQKEIASRELTAHEWCRKAALERLNNNYGLSKAERLLLEHFVRAQYLVTGFSIISRWQLNRQISGKNSSLFSRLDTKSFTPAFVVRARNPHATVPTKEMRKSRLLSRCSRNPNSGRDQHAIEDSKEYLKASEINGRNQSVMAQSRTFHRNV